jgi:hypothetical protein
VWHDWFFLERGGAETFVFGGTSGINEPPRLMDTRVSGGSVGHPMNNTWLCAQRFSTRLFRQCDKTLVVTLLHQHEDTLVLVIAEGLVNIGR